MFMFRDPETLFSRFNTLINSDYSPQNRSELCSTTKWICDCLAKEKLAIDIFNPLYSPIYHWIAACKDVSVIQELLHLLVILHESHSYAILSHLETVVTMKQGDFPKVRDGLQLIFSGVTFIVSRGAYQCVSYGLDVLYTIFHQGTHSARLSEIDPNSVISLPWRSTLFYQLYSMLFIVGNCAAEVSNTLKQMIAILVLMQKSDQTLEFKNSLSSERLFLNKYPELKRDFEPIAMGVLTTGRVRGYF